MIRGWRPNKRAILLITLYLCLLGPCHLAKDCKNNAACIGNADGSVTCRCRTTDECPKETDGVCGSDGQTYINRCHLDVAACANKKTIEVRHKGPCGEMIMIYSIASIVGALWLVEGVAMIPNLFVVPLMFKYLFLREVFRWLMYLSIHLHRFLITSGTFLPRRHLIAKLRIFASGAFLCFCYFTVKTKR